MLLSVPEAAKSWTGRASAPRSRAGSGEAGTGTERVTDRCRGRRRTLRMHEPGFQAQKSAASPDAIDAACPCALRLPGNDT
jgi:hypothetical protein